MLILIRYLDYRANDALTPPVAEGMVNTDHIVFGVPTEARGEGPFVRLTMVSGDKIIACGRVGDFLPKSPRPY